MRAELYIDNFVPNNFNLIYRPPRLCWTFCWTVTTWSRCWPPVAGPATLRTPCVTSSTLVTRTFPITSRTWLPAMDFCLWAMVRVGISTVWKIFYCAQRLHWHRIRRVVAISVSHGWIRCWAPKLFACQRPQPTTVTMINMKSSTRRRWTGILNLFVWLVRCCRPSNSAWFDSVRVRWRHRNGRAWTQSYGRRYRSWLVLRSRPSVDQELIRRFAFVVVVITAVSMGFLIFLHLFYCDSPWRTVQLHRTTAAHRTCTR